MLRCQLKSKLHRAKVNDANAEYEGSVSIDTEIMAEADLWPGERVSISSVDTGARLETYVQPGEKGAKRIVINGGAAHRIGKGERVTIMAYAWHEQKVKAKKILLGEKEGEENVILRKVEE